MDDLVMVQILVSREAAAALEDDSRRQTVGKLVSDLLRPATPQDDPLAKLIAEVKIEARADELTDDAINTELATYNAENRFRR
ncbi:MAG TPA: hypothetical protein VIJ42_05255 [Stellaceae bacterium]